MKQPDKFFNIGIPGRDVLIADRPVNTVAIVLVGFEIQITPTIDTVLTGPSTTLSVRIVSLPVFSAAGSVELWELK